MQVKKQQLELDMEQQTVSKSGKEYVKDAYCHPAYLTYMESTSWEMPGWMKHKLESRDKIEEITWRRLLIEDFNQISKVNTWGDTTIISVEFKLTYQAHFTDQTRSKECLCRTTAYIRKIMRVVESRGDEN